MAMDFQGQTKRVARLPSSVSEALFTPFRAAGTILASPFSRRAREEMGDFIRYPFTKQVGNPIGAVTEAERLARRVEKESTAFSGLSIESNRAVSRTFADEGARKGYIGASLMHLWYRAQETVGVDMSKIGGNKLSKNAYEAGEALARRSKASIPERLLSKPFRIAARYPVPALIFGGAAALWGGSNWLSNRDAERTKIETLNAMAASQAPMGSPVMNNPYMNSVNPMEAALLEARMRGGEGVRNGFSDKIMADRAAAAALANPAQQNS